ncbi:hypothetical protein [Plasmodium yoelii yoelii]|uniref:Uncharacterized protein n=2 Tax=Plasmodium yoelii yoelii TaxID=73239 RepID=Q7RHY5_PLAYO|nr:hypothetical protein [Plasmodium yoelii yoelii]
MQYRHFILIILNRHEQSIIYIILYGKYCMWLLSYYMPLFYIILNHNPSMGNTTLTLTHNIKTI